MKLLRLIVAGCVAALLTGCAIFKSPSAGQTKRNEHRAGSAEGRREEFDRDAAIRDRASAYEKKGMSKAEALSAAQAESTGKRSWP